MLNFEFVKSNKVGECQISSNIPIIQTLVEFVLSPSPNNLPSRAENREREGKHKILEFLIIKRFASAFSPLG